ncbi:2TM domain-containing protein [Altibacter sp. HG106]|uniref:2TM domain-containing protein n=1 Tax=Altibacter sp. HG106 TaxID=3023937 RepID=UPI002350163C|nr:2TM domain-containing protein [Altibacter sp. HG106]MDC7993817.1 2TM domain-containing protein [Altibacter sp. HG106]
MDVTMKTSEEKNKETAYERARKKVDAIKGFHGHLKVFVVINLLLVILRMELGKLITGTVELDEAFSHWLDWNTYFSTGLWAIALLIHGLYVYRDSFGFVKRWEDRKMKEFLDNDEKNKP